MPQSPLSRTRLCGTCLRADFIGVSIQESSDKTEPGKAPLDQEEWRIKPPRAAPPQAVLSLYGGNRYSLAQKRTQRRLEAKAANKYNVVASAFAGQTFVS